MKLRGGNSQVASANLINQFVAFTCQYFLFSNPHFFQVQDEEAEKNVECIDESDEELSCKPPVRGTLFDRGS